jgi:uncharacterized caspase-like protein
MLATFRNTLMLISLAASCAATPAFADKRVALIIGNSAYEKVSRLDNPANDAGLMAETLKAAGFDSVDTRRDLKIEDMRRALREFVDKSRDADVAVVYYAGHGMEIDGTNYLIPVDAVLQRDSDIYDEALSLDRVLISVEPAKQLRLVILDACRDNPFARTMKRAIAARSIGRGLAKVEPTSPNTLIAFASKAGSTAGDGDGKNSPFATAVAKYVTRPGLDLRKAFGYVRDDVLRSTANRQEPYVYGSLGGDDFSLVAAKPDPVGPQADPQTTVRRDYESALQLGTRDGWDAYLAQHPDGFYANLAKGQVKKIAAEEVRAASAEKARLAEEERVRLTAESAREAEIAKATAAAKLAEVQRAAAETAKQLEQEKVAAAENTRIAAQENARKSAENAGQGGEAKVGPAAATGEQAAGDKQQLTALLPTDNPEKATVDIPRALQIELRRVGCNTGSVDGNWNGASRQALDLFNKHAGMKLDTVIASADALDAVKSKLSRICPLACDRGYRADGERCLKIECGAGSFLNGENECEAKKTTPRKPKERIVERSQEFRSPPAMASPPPGTFGPGRRGQPWLRCGAGGKMSGAC